MIPLNSSLRRDRGLRAHFLLAAMLASVASLGHPVARRRAEQPEGVKLNHRGLPMTEWDLQAKARAEAKRARKAAAARERG